MDRARDPLGQANEAEQAEEARTRRALLHMLEDLQREQARLRRARHEWLGTVDAIADPLMVHDAELRVVRCNRAYAAKAGMAFKEILGRPYWECFPRRSGPLEACLLQLEAGASGAHDTEISLDTGEVFVSRAYSVRDGEAGYVLHLFENVTEKRRIQEAIAASEHRFRSLFESMLEGFAHCRMTVDASGRPDCVYLEVNPAFARLTGLTDVIGKTLGEIVPDIHESNPELLVAYAGVAAGGAPQRLETYVKGLDRWLAIFAYSAGDNTFIAVFDDISERRQNELALQQSEQRLAVATKSARIGVWDWDVVANRLVWDARMYELYGVGKQDFGGAFDTWQAGLHPEDRERASAEVAAVVAGDRDFNTEFRIVWPGGEVRHIEAHAMVQRAEDGTARRLIGVNWDVTERRRDEAELRKSEEKLRAIFNATVDGIVVVDPETRKLVSANTAFCEMMRYLPEEIPALHASDLHPAESLEWILAEFGRHATGEISVTADAPMKRKDGSVFHADITTGRTFVGEDAQMLVVFHDVTKRKAAGRQLRESEEKFRAIFSNTVDGIALFEIEARSIKYANEGMARLLGYAVAELEGLPLERLLQPEAAARVMQEFDRGAKGQSKGVADIPLLKKDGAVVYVDITGAPVEIGGRTFLTGSFRDATPRRAGEEKLRAQVEELQRWQGLNLNREDRVVELKHEVNELARKLNLPPPYAGGE